MQTRSGERVLLSRMDPRSFWVIEGVALEVLVVMRPDFESDFNVRSSPEPSAASLGEESNLQGQPTLPQSHAFVLVVMRLGLRSIRP